MSIIIIIVFIWYYIFMKTEINASKRRIFRLVNESVGIDVIRFFNPIPPWTKIDRNITARKDKNYICIYIWLKAHIRLYIKLSFDFFLHCVCVCARVLYCNANLPYNFFVYFNLVFIFCWIILFSIVRVNFIFYTVHVYAKTKFYISSIQTLTLALLNKKSSMKCR